VADTSILSRRGTCSATYPAMVSVDPDDELVHFDLGITDDRFVPLATLVYQVRVAHLHGACVECDDNCRAPFYPVLPEDYVTAYKHWRFHARNDRCSHGC
jgi:hypothetical protein